MLSIKGAESGVPNRAFRRGRTKPRVPTVGGSAKYSSWLFVLMMVRPYVYGGEYKPPKFNRGHKRRRPHRGITHDGVTTAMDSTARNNLFPLACPSTSCSRGDTIAVPETHCLLVLRPMPRRQSQACLTCCYAAAVGKGVIQRPLQGLGAVRLRGNYTPTVDRRGPGSGPDTRIRLATAIPSPRSLSSERRRFEKQTNKPSLRTYRYQCQDTSQRKATGRVRAVFPFQQTAAPHPHCLLSMPRQCPAPKSGSSPLQIHGYTGAGRQLKVYTAVETETESSSITPSIGRLWGRVADLLRALERCLNSRRPHIFPVSQYVRPCLPGLPDKAPVRRQRGREKRSMQAFCWFLFEEERTRPSHTPVLTLHRPDLADLTRAGACLVCKC
ncbi:uncharacterized protein B0T15DRAFT_102314 [Chaetomium strumarium]|uniref:Uncharacterized protein n=1 Tax=Chaetomium strumarium TaxID=1170767 RepID=A0AAJ0GY38_9PEZI|nr:hypothetical protein B0T15DRAFT_102314 [Chaetomium strumarium]